MITVLMESIAVFFLIIFAFISGFLVGKSRDEVKDIIRKLLMVLLFFGAPAFTHGQSVTNITYKITVETVTAGVTNSVNSTLNLDFGTKADAAKINGAALAYAVYRAGGGSSAFEVWLKQNIKDRLKEYADAKSRQDNATLAAKIDSLLLSNPDLLSASDLVNLATIAAKVPLQFLRALGGLLFLAVK